MALSKNDNEDSLRIDSDQVPGAAINILRLTGVVDAHTYQDLEAAFEELIEDEVVRLIVDVSAVRYVSSAGIGVFIGALARTRQLGGDLLLINVTPAVKDVLEVLGLLSMFVIAPTKQAALVYYQRRTAVIKK